MRRRSWIRRHFARMAGIVAAALIIGSAAAEHAPFQLRPTPAGHALTSDEIQELAARFTQNPLRGGQTAPRLYAPVNDDVSIFLQFDRANPNEATQLRYIGIGRKGTFCESGRPSADFTPALRPAGAELRRGARW